MISTIVITSGDIDGVGFEVTCKALEKIGPQKKISFVCYYQNDSQIKYFIGSKLKKFKKKFITSFDETLGSANAGIHLFFLKDLRSPARWVESAAQICMEKKAAALVTGPLSKQEIHASGMSDMGHTGILKRVSNTQNVFMLFLGKFFNVVLVTGHVPINRILPELSAGLYSSLISLLFKGLGSQVLKRGPVAVLGINPHAGDDGLIGDEENTLLKPIVKSGKVRGYPMVGPLVPDVAFHKKNWKKFSLYIAAYHDQGLIPFKLVHGFSGVQVSLGLPFLRISVDHGTAKDIFRKNKADPSSMIEALRWAIKLIRRANV